MQVSVVWLCRECYISASGSDGLLAPRPIRQKLAKFMSQIHWNYFLALEKDLDNLSRYIEFNKSNFLTYSIENAKILMAATQEVDVLFKTIYSHYGGTKKKPDIKDYHDVIKKYHSDIFRAKVTLISHAMIMTPFARWTKNASPKWWKANNDVKHNRDTLFNQACLKHVVDAVSALLLLNVHYYALKEKDRRFWPEQDSKLFELEKNKYYGSGGHVLKKCYTIP